MILPKMWNVTRRAAIEVLEMAPNVLPNTLRFAKGVAQGTGNSALSSVVKPIIENMQNSSKRLSRNLRNPLLRNPLKRPASEKSSPPMTPPPCPKKTSSPSMPTNLVKSLEKSNKKGTCSTKQNWLDRMFNSASEYVKERFGESSERTPEEPHLREKEVVVLDKKVLEEHVSTETSSQTTESEAEKSTPEAEKSTPEAEKSTPEVEKSTPEAEPEKPKKENSRRPPIAGPSCSLVPPPEQDSVLILQGATSTLAPAMIKEALKTGRYSKIICFYREGSKPDTNSSGPIEWVPLPKTAYTDYKNLQETEVKALEKAKNENPNIRRVHVINTIGGQKPDPDMLTAPVLVGAAAVHSAAKQVFGSEIETSMASISSVASTIVPGSDYSTRRDADDRTGLAFSKLTGVHFFVGRVGFIVNTVSEEEREYSSAEIKRQEELARHSSMQYSLTPVQPVLGPEETGKIPVVGEQDLAEGTFKALNQRVTGIINAITSAPMTQEDLYRRFRQIAGITEDPNFIHIPVGESTTTLLSEISDGRMQKYAAALAAAVAQGFEISPAAWEELLGHKSTIDRELGPDASAAVFIKVTGYPPVWETTKKVAKHLIQNPRKIPKFVVASADVLKKIIMANVFNKKDRLNTDTTDWPKRRELWASAAEQYAQEVAQKMVEDPSYSSSQELKESYLKWYEEHEHINVDTLTKSQN